MDPFNQVLYWLIANSLGGKNRIRILKCLFESPKNANEISQYLKIDYKTIRYHLKILKQNNLLETAGSGYGKTYFISNQLEENKYYFDKFCNKINDKSKK